jgi:uncharacterized protein YdhG (YjbR/CyaY superfamily)
MSTIKYKTIQEYWNSFDGVAFEKMKELHQCILQTIPNAEPCISYNMPAFKIGKIIAYYAGYKNHIGFYPMPACIQHFATELKPYKTSKGAVQFALDEPLPHDLIEKMIHYNTLNIQ